MDHATRLSGKTTTVDDVDPLQLVPAACGIAFMAKVSAPGRAKTRLVPPLTFEEAAALNTAFLQDVADNVLRASGRAAVGAGIAGYAAFSPSGSVDFFRHILPAEIGLVEAWLPNFGDCLYRTIREILARGHKSAVVLNSDSPTLPTELLIETAAVLAEPGDRAVLGTSSDGGYYLLGLKAAHRRLFEDIDWSTERVSTQTLQRATEIGLQVHCLPVWYDVDNVDDLRRLRIELEVGQDVRAAKLRPHYARHTAMLLNGFSHKHDFNRRVGELSDAEPLQA